MADGPELYGIDLSPNNEVAHVPANAAPNGSIGGGDVGGDPRDDRRILDLLPVLLKSPLRKKGDLWGFGITSTNHAPFDARIPVGTDGQVLTARASAAMGVDWEASASGTNLMNVDMVVDSNGKGTHTALYGASGALAAAIATGLSRVIWVCTTHVEPTVTTEQVLLGFANNQAITVLSGGPFRPSINVNLTGELHKQTLASPNSGSGWVLRFQDIAFTQTGGTPNFYSPQGGIGGVQLQLIDVTLGGNWGTLYDGNTGASCSFGNFILDRCRGDGGSGVIDSILTLSTSAAGAGALIMRDCYDMTLNYVAQRGNSTDVDPFSSINIHSNVLKVQQYLWKKTYNAARLSIQGNDFVHTGAVDFIGLGTAGSTDTTDNVVTDNNYYGTAAGQTFVHMSVGAGQVKNTIVTDNNIHGPGSGTAILIDAVAEMDVLVDNAYTGWTDNVAGDSGARTLLGDSPHQFHNSTSTTDATQKTIQTFKVNRSRTTVFRTVVTARRTGGSAGTAGDGAGYVITACYRNEAFAAVLIGAVNADFTAEDQAGWDATFTISGENMLVRVTGALNNNIDWQAVTQAFTVA